VLDLALPKTEEEALAVLVEENIIGNMVWAKKVIDETKSSARICLGMHRLGFLSGKSGAHPKLPNALLKAFDDHCKRVNSAWTRMESVCRRENLEKWFPDFYGEDAED